ncbi:MAG: tetratricopeptide repeat protein [Pseudomonadota bacterium]
MLESEQSGAVNGGATNVISNTAPGGPGNTAIESSTATKAESTPTSGVDGNVTPYGRTSAELLKRSNASAEEDFKAGVMVYARGEMIEAQGILERAANAGHAGAMAILGEILERSGFVAEAAAWYRKSAELGNAEGQFHLASMYLDLQSYSLNNVGVSRDLGEARKWFIRSAEQGHLSATGVVLAAYLTGGLGLKASERTDAEVLKWINRAKDLNNADAMDALANAYRLGKYGLAVDSLLADEWTVRANEVRGIKPDENTARRVFRKKRL